MREFEIVGTPHRTRRLSAYAQWNLLQAVAPALGPLSDIGFGLRLPNIGLQAAASVLMPLASMSEADLSAVIAACCDACERQKDGAWVSVSEAPRLSDLTAMFLAVTTENFGRLYALERPKFDRTEPPYTYRAVALPNGRDWLYRPVTRGCCRLESLHDGALRIEHIAEMNMALDILDENEARARKAAEKVK